MLRIPAMNTLQPLSKTDADAPRLESDQLAVSVDDQYDGYLYNGEREFEFPAEVLERAGTVLDRSPDSFQVSLIEIGPRKISLPKDCICGAGSRPDIERKLTEMGIKCPICNP